MNQYLITAYDYTDDKALERRMAARTEHLTRASKLKADGTLVVGGAILSPEGQMIGSMMLMQFESADGLEAWKQDEPYLLQKVWEKVTIEPFRSAQL
ncbi:MULTISPECIES: YciI family protein [Hymenobacter]|uniref:YCII-related domain-containing protein n=1 Tax=Hymenobacter jejuensis TaxID=2502781 RepID=A0A5B8A640_9BACT|nr:MULTISPECIES: YciI family protein [Hymenobacter]MBC6989677.1 hypothetical protein [Hymenobacter sp. BT491]QDA61732.1 hypothetical protein FHG12_17250 [Hymenobacter jejuensis]